MPATAPASLLAAVGAALLGDLRGALLVGGAIVGILAISEVLHRALRVPAEATRKVSHLGSGVVVLAFPWLLGSAWTVGVLAAIFLALLWAGRVTGLLSSVHGVRRRTGGAFWYPVAVLGTWLLAGGDPLRFSLPVAVMAVADTGAAWVGKTWGEREYRVLDGWRTFEGSLTFFGITFGLVLGALALSGEPPWPAPLLVAVVAAVLAGSVEAVSVRGSDNLFIPYAVWLVLEHTLRGGLEALSAWILGMLVALAGIAATWRFAAMTPAGALLSFVLVALAWALGGPAWVAPIGVLHGLHLLLRPPVAPTDLEDVFPHTAGGLLLVLALAHGGGPGLLVPYLATVSASAAILPVLRLSGPWRWPVAGLATLLPPLAALPWHRDLPVGPVALGGAVGLGLYLALARLPWKGRRLAACLATGGLAWWVLGRG